MRKLLLILLCFPFLVFSQNEKRLALVIGNANYDKGELKNPVNDALLIVKTLEKLDFEVILDTNIANRGAFVEVIEKFGDKRYYSNSYVPLLFREGPNINSKVLNRISYGEELIITSAPLTKHNLIFNFSTNFKANYKSINYNTHTIESYYVKANYKGVKGYVYFGLLSEKKPIDFAMFFEVSKNQNTGEGNIIFKDQDTTMMISEDYDYEEYIDKDAGNCIASKRIKTYQNNIIIIEEDNEKTRTVRIELPIDSIDDFYILSNNLLRYLNSHTFDHLNISKDSWHISFSEMGPDIFISISENEKKIYIVCYYGGC